ncbi:MAG TPA: C25 family peptidase propeptide domain-containing protein, partial [Candidatus Kapabacteria bacterium]|nr:C25 family peptidase propeptide domain-containing protein [Candidatus Kapabacteria bacterium]
MVFVLTAGALFASHDLFAAGANTPDYRIISSNAQEMVVEYKPAYAPTDTLTIDGKRYLRFHFRDESEIHPGKAGTPDILGRAFTLGLPSFTGNSVQIISAEYETVQGIPAPVPELVHDSYKVDVTEKYIVNDVAYRSAASFPSAPAAIQDFGMMRNERVGALVFFPIQYSAGTPVIRKATRIIARVRFGA